MHALLHVLCIGHHLSPERKQICRLHLLLTSLLSASSSIEVMDLVCSTARLLLSGFGSCLVFQYCSHCRRFHLGASSRPSPAAITACSSDQPQPALNLFPTAGDIITKHVFRARILTCI